MTVRQAPIEQECVEAYLYTRRPVRILVLRRPPNRRRFWVPVSGKVESGDVRYSAAVVREVREETGFTRFHRVVPLRWQFRFRGPDGRRWRLHAFAVELARPREPRLSGEHEAFAWLSPADALRRLHYRDNRTALRKLLRRLERSERGRVRRARSRNV